MAFESHHYHRGGLEPDGLVVETSTNIVENEEEETKPLKEDKIVGIPKDMRIGTDPTTMIQQQQAPLPRFNDHGEFGFYKGLLNETGDQRHGYGTMIYDSGNIYTGPFINNRFHGSNGIYKWFDGDEQEGNWAEGERHGTSIFRCALDGTVEYSIYESGSAVGAGVMWVANRKTAYKMKDGKKDDEITLELAEQFAKDKFGWGVPEPTEVASRTRTAVDAPPSTTTTSKSIGLISRLFSKKKVGPDGTLFFKDYNEWGYYTGDVDSDGKRQGEGKMTYDSGNYYEGGFEDDKFHDDKKGVYHWQDGDEYSGGWKDGERNGIGSFTKADGTVEYSQYEDGNTKGEGVAWSADRKTAYKLEDGEQTVEITIEEAEGFAKEKFNLPVPEPAEVTPPSSEVIVDSSKSSKSIGLIGRLFSSRRVNSEGTLFVKDYGEWGSYAGVVDDDGKRQGKGKMTYDSGNYYEGEFVDDKFHGDNGVYKWFDGDKYVGSWKDGERHGIGSFAKADGSVEYSIYEEGIVKGQGISWSSDRKAAHKMLDGEKQIELSIEEAEALSKEKFNLPIPEPSMPDENDVPSAMAVSKPKEGLIGRLFPKKKVGPDGKLLFKDYGEWGSYDGDVDSEGNREGKGKMTYESGNSYEGGFVNNKFHGDNGVYKWFDGDKYVGSWKDGERHGIGSFTKADGSVDYSMYEEGSTAGEGVSWSGDRKTAHKLVDGDKKNEISVGMAKKLSREKFNLPIPEPCTTATPLQESVAVTASNKNKSGLLGRLFASRKFDADGKPLFKDYGDWGSYDGVVDENGKRQGEGKMKYNSGNSYEGGFVDDKFDGEKGTYKWVDGDEYVGSWKDGERNGTGSFTKADGSVEYSIYEDGVAKDGVWWSQNRDSAYTMVDGEKKIELLVEEAEVLSKEKFNLPIPEVSKSTIPSTPTSKGFLRRLFSDRKVGPDGKLMFKDYGEWGSYDGDVDSEGNREGKGNMTYESGNSYKGGFVNNEFHGDSGVYKWFDGDEYAGSWKDGERNGIGSFSLANGITEYAKFDDGSAKGEGVSWGADRQTAYKMSDGNKGVEMSLAVAEKFAKDNFDLPVPEPHTPSPSQPEAKSWLTGRLFLSKGKAGASPKEGPRFEDFGDSGVYYEGDLVDGVRQGQGKMSYDSGNSYEGDFADDKYHGNKGLYRWADGTEYEGSWKGGAFHGIGIFRASTGVDFSIYEDGVAVGVGILWTDDSTKAYYTLDGVKMNEMPLGDATKLAKSKFGLPAPSSKRQLGIISRVFSRKKVDADGKPLFKDYGDWGSYEGDLKDGDRHGNGKMVYDSGNYYEGGFLNNKFHGKSGTYQWADGDKYVGSWKDGERHGFGAFTNADGSVEYSMYESGQAQGDGVSVGSDAQTAYKMVDGEQTVEITLKEADSIKTSLEQASA